MQFPLLTALLALLISSAAPAATFPAAENPTAIVERIRGHRFERPVERRLLARTALRAYLRNHLETEIPTGPEFWLAALETLQLIEPHDDVETVLLDLYEAQVLAFYDPRAHIYYALDEPPEGISLLPFMETAVEIHELTHALQDQTFDAGATMLSLRENWDAQLAYQALLEGEATLVMVAWLVESMGLDLHQAVMNPDFFNALPVATEATAAPAGVPPYFVASMQFPYVSGLRLVVEAFRRDGWNGVDRLHSEPPASTSEVLHPERYFARTAGDRRSDLVADSTTLRTILGEFHWRFLLGDAAADGWVNDETMVRRTSLGNTVTIASRWSDSCEAAEFAESYRRLLTERGLEPVVLRDGSQVEVAYGADPLVMHRFLSAPAAR